MKFGRIIRNFGGESVWSDTYLLIVSGEEYFSVVVSGPEIKMKEMAF